MENWKNIIIAVKSPISLAALAFLVVNGLLLIVVNGYEPESWTREWFPILALIFLLIIVVMSLSKKQNPEHKKEDLDRKIEDIISDL